MKIIEQLKPLAVKINSVKPDPKNARAGHAIFEIAKSLKKYGQRKPIVVNKKTGYIEAGNGTWKAAKHLEWEQIAAVYVEDDAEAAIGYGVADNRLGDMSFFDISSLEELFEDIDPLDIPGVDLEWLDSLRPSDGESLEYLDLSEDGYENDGNGNLSDGNGIHALAITVDDETLEKWNAIKEKLKKKTDSAAFVAMIGNYKC